MNYLVTGAAGFIGSHLCEALLNAGHEVIGVDNFSTSDGTNIELLSSYERFRFIEHDVTVPLSIDQPLDRVMHFASPASPPTYLRLALETMQVNSIGTENMLKLAESKGARFIFASTSEIYGDPLEHPQRESYRGNVNTVGPRSVYDEAKRFGETLVMLYRDRFGVDTRIVRIFNTYGPRMQPDDGRVVSNFIVQAQQGNPITIYGSGSQSRSFCYVTDLTRQILGVLDSDYPHPVNVGNDNEFTIEELAHLVQKLIPSHSNIVYEDLPEDDPKCRRPDLQTIRELIDLQTPVTLEEGIQRTAQTFAEALHAGS